MRICVRSTRTDRQRKWHPHLDVVALVSVLTLTTASCYYAVHKTVTAAAAAAAVAVAVASHSMLWIRSSRSVISHFVAQNILRWFNSSHVGTRNTCVNFTLPCSKRETQLSQRNRAMLNIILMYKKPSTVAQLQLVTLLIYKRTYYAVSIHFIFSIVLVSCFITDYLATIQESHIVL